MIRAIYFDDGPVSRFSSLAVGSGTLLHTPILCILTGTEPPIADFQLPFFGWLNHFPSVHETVSGDYKPEKAKAANVPHWQSIRP